MLKASDTSADRDKGIAGAKQSGENAIKLSVAMSNDAIAGARVQLDFDTMQRELKGDSKNFSLLAAKYLWSCKDIVERPDKRVAYWVTKKSNSTALPAQQNTTKAAPANDERFSLLCYRVKDPKAPPMAFDVNLRTSTVTSPDNYLHLTKPPNVTITEREIEVRQDYETGWSVTIIDRYTGNGTEFSASRPDATASDREATFIHCTKTAGKAF